MPQQSQATGRSGSALFESLAITQKEHKMVETWAREAAKAHCSINSHWSMGQFLTDDEVRSQMQRLREFLISAARAATNLTLNARAYGTWRLLSPNPEAARMIRRLFRINEQNEAVGVSVECAHMTPDVWLNAVFQELTGVDYTHFGRAQQLSSFGLCDNWKFGLARSQVTSWVDCIREDSMKRTWQEAQRDVRSLLEATTFGSVLEARAMPRIEVIFMQHSASGDQYGYWSQVETLLVEYLEGTSGLFNDWHEFKSRTEANLEYRGPTDYSKVPWTVARNTARRSQYQSRDRRQQPRVNQLGQDGTPGVSWGTAGDVFALPEIQYEAMEEAQRHKMTPCAWHIQKLLDNPRNTRTPAELAERMHPTCACLNVQNPLLRCTLLDGGLDAIVRRSQMLDTPEKEQLWKEQMTEVRSKVRALQNGSVNMMVESWINEVGDGVVAQESEDGPCLLQTAGPPRF
jgi:hypothetical protein